MDLAICSMFSLGPLQNGVCSSQKYPDIWQVALIDVPFEDAAEGLRGWGVPLLTPGTRSSVVVTPRS